MDGLTINEAAETTGWSARMLRYIEELDLVMPARSGSGYRIYGPGELQRLRTLKELLDRHNIGLGDLGFAKRVQREKELRTQVDEWLDAEPARPEHIDEQNWLSWEQEKHQRLLQEIDDALGAQPKTAEIQ